LWLSNSILLLFSGLLSLLRRDFLSDLAICFFCQINFSDGGCDDEEIIELQQLSHRAVFVMNLSQVIAFIRKVFNKEAIGNDLSLILLLILTVGWNGIAPDLEAIK
jgi:hypothetical protein